MGTLSGKVALITGAARGQGRSHALRLAEDGADIIAFDICNDIASNEYPMGTAGDLAETASAVEARGRRVVANEVDVRDPVALRAALAEGVAALGGLDVVVANAGICPLGDHRVQDAFVDVVDINLIGAINTIHAALAHLQTGASIIAIGSLAAFMSDSVDNPAAGPGGAGYGFAKRMLAGYVHELARQLAPQSIRVNAVHPTNCNTLMLQSEGMYRIFRPDLEHPTREDAEPNFALFNTMPVGYVEPKDVSNAVAFLASEQSSFITGAQLRVDAGGYLKLKQFEA